MAEVSPEDELDAMLKAEGVAEAVPPEKAAAAAGGGKVELSGDSQKLQEFADLMKKVPLLRSLAEEEQLKIAALLKAREFEDGENIIVQGEEGDCMYFVQSGEVSRRRTSALLPCAPRRAPLLRAPAAPPNAVGERRRQLLSVDAPDALSAPHLAAR